MISLGYDTLCRSCELAALNVEHLRRPDDGEWSVFIPRSKGDQAGDYRLPWLSPRSVELLQQWLAESRIAIGPLSRSLHLGRVSDSALNTSSIRRAVKRVSARAGVDTTDAQQLSDNPMRVGAAQDLLVAGFDALAIMQAGGWKSTNVLLRYVENASTRGLHSRRWNLVAAAAPQRPTHVVWAGIGSGTSPLLAWLRATANNASRLRNPPEARTQCGQGGAEYELHHAKSQRLGV